MTTSSTFKVIPGKQLERILTMGITGSGKSYNWLKLARELMPSGIKFYAIDTDNDINYMLYSNFAECAADNGGNVHVYSAYEWLEYKARMAEIIKLNPKPGDFMIVDKINHSWPAVQRYFVKEVFKDQIGDYFLRVRKQMENEKKADEKNKDSSVVKESLDGWMDWPVINTMYADWIAPLIYQTHCNVYCATDVEQIDKKEKNAEIKELFGAAGVKPAGQKAIGGQFHTIFLLLPGTDKWYIRTIKDRANRPYFKDVQLQSFLMQYLILKAGWKMV